MSRAVHLATVDGQLCSVRSAGSAVAGDLAVVTCRNCAASLDREITHGTDLYWQRVWAEQRRAAAESVGMGHIWDALSAEEQSPTRDLLLGIVGSLARGLDEMGYRP